VKKVAAKRASEAAVLCGSNIIHIASSSTVFLAHISFNFINLFYFSSH
jgi:hypothetical protein